MHWRWFFGGTVTDRVYAEGLHIPVNPLYQWYLFDVRQKTHKETANVPSQDQLQTRVDVSVQYRLRGSEAPAILQQTGQASQVLEVHLIPKLRSVLREQGKSIRRAEDFFLEETQNRLQGTLQTELQGTAVTISNKIRQAAVIANNPDTVLTLAKALCEIQESFFGAGGAHAGSHGSLGEMSVDEFERYLKK